MSAQKSQKSTASFIKWHEVTWYSKFTSIVVLIGIVPLLAFYIGTQYDQVQLYVVSDEEASELVPSLAQLTTIFGHVSNSPGFFKPIDQQATDKYINIERASRHTARLTMVITDKSNSSSVGSTTQYTIATTTSIEHDGVIDLRLGTSTPCHIYIITYQTPKQVDTMLHVFQDENGAICGLGQDSDFSGSYKRVSDASTTVSSKSSN